MNENKRIMPTKIELTLEQSQQGVSDDVLKDVMDPVMQYTTLPSHLSFSQKKLVLFVTEIHTLSIDISLQIVDIEKVAVSSSLRLLKPKSYALSWKPCQGDSLNLPDHRYKRRCCSPILAKLDSSPHAHTQALEVNHSASRLLILNFLKDLQSQIKNRILGRVLAL
ncbi:hypothetical protein Tco_0488786 [Tanacetum coccineum]